MESALRELSVLTSSKAEWEESVFDFITTITPDEFINPARFDDYVGKLLALVDVGLIQKNDDENRKILGLVTRVANNLQTIIQEYKQLFDSTPTESQWKGFAVNTTINIDRESYYAATLCIKRLKQYLKSHQVKLENMEEEVQPIVKAHKPKQAKETASSSRQSEWLTTDDVCAILKVTGRTVQNYRDEGKLAFRKTGQKIYYRREDVEEYINHYHPKK